MIFMVTWGVQGEEKGQTGRLGLTYKHYYVYNKVTSKDLLYSTENATQCCYDQMGKESKSVVICIYITGSLCCTSELTQHCKSITQLSLLLFSH